MIPITIKIWEYPHDDSFIDYDQEPDHQGMILCKTTDDLNVLVEALEYEERVILNWVYPDQWYEHWDGSHPGSYVGDGELE